ncbi:MAG: thiosulfate sulfurtransferase GlpE [Idiomarina sp.]|nr:thiosulfate sulfurtransferase GlpE [Idiomarina sp.]
MATFKRLSIEEARTLMAARDPVIADIRDAQSFASGHIVGSVPLTNDNLHDFVLNTATERPVVVVCYHGVSSQGAARYLAEQGFAEVYSLDGGFTAWAEYQPDQVATQYGR